jgi:D-3-phosphoglycerate dehydrogenase
MSPIIASEPDPEYSVEASVFRRAFCCGTLQIRRLNRNLTRMQTVAVTDYTFPSLEIEESILQSADCRVIGAQCRTVESLIPHVAEADVVITQFAPVNAAVVNAMQRARVIVRYGIGVDNVDLEAARLKGIPVCNVPGFCIDEVADHTLAFILGITRQVVSNTLHVRDGKWGLATGLDRLLTLRDQTVGIVGFGRIGREVAARLAPFKCRRLVHDPVVPSEAIRNSGCEVVSLATLLSESDIVTLHCPSTPKTKKLLNAESIASLKPGAIVINLARGDLIDTPSLESALRSGHLAGAALDVCDPEPIPLDSPLRSLPNVIVASHIASASVKAVRTLRETAARIAGAALRGESLPNVVNGVV